MAGSRQHQREMVGRAGGNRDWVICCRPAQRSRLARLNVNGSGMHGLFRSTRQTPSCALPCPVHLHFCHSRRSFVQDLLGRSAPPGSFRTQHSLTCHAWPPLQPKDPSGTSSWAPLRAWAHRSGAHIWSTRPRAPRTLIPSTRSARCWGESTSLLAVCGEANRPSLRMHLSQRPPSQLAVCCGGCRGGALDGP